MQQLFINGKAVDMPSDEIKIKVESNILNDADKIKTAHSYNIALPRTLTNDAIFYDAFVPSADTGGKSTHTYLTASLNVDDVPLFTNGQAVLTSVDDKGYNLTLLWGILGIFDEIKREGLSLNELPLSQYWSERENDWFLLRRYNGIVENDYNSGMNTTVYDSLNADSVTEANRLPWNMPTNNALDLLNEVADVYGLNLSLSPLAQQRLSLLDHIATTLHSITKGEVIKFSTSSIMTQISSNKYYINWASGAGTGATPCAEAYNNAVQYVSDSPSFYYSARVAVNVKKVRVWGYRTTNDYSVIFPLPYETQINPTYNPVTNRWEIDHTWYNKQMDAGHPFPVIGVGNDGVPLGNGLFHLEVEIDEVADIEVGYYWSYTRNAPDIDIIKYISELLVHIGAFIVGSLTETDTLRIITFDEVLAKSSVGYDMQGVDNITMSLDDLAQRNKYIHKENNADEAEGLPPYTAEGVIYTNDSTLELEREAFKSAFAVPRFNKVFNWKVEKLEKPENSTITHKATWVDAGLNIVGSDITFHFLNTGQDFESIIAECYAGYEQLIKRPKAVEVVVRLSILELMAIDFTAPVHINQLNRDYLIISVESDTGDNYKLKLIQI